MADGPTGARVDGMGDPLAPLLVVVSIVPGGGQGEVPQRDDELNSSLAGVGYFDGDSPWIAIRVRARGADFTTDFHHEVLDILALEGFGHLIDAEPLGNGRQVQAELRNELADGRAVGQKLQELPTRHCEQAIDGRLIGWVGRPSGRPEAPGIDQRSDRDIEGTTGKPADSEGMVENLEGLLGDRVGLVALPLIEQCELGVAEVVGHLGIHLGEPALDQFLERGSALVVEAVCDDLDRVVGAHGGPGKGVEPRFLGRLAAGQEEACRRQERAATAKGSKAVRQ